MDHRALVTWPQLSRAVLQPAPQQALGDKCPTHHLQSKERHLLTLGVLLFPRFQAGKELKTAFVGFFPPLYPVFHQLATTPSRINKPQPGTESQAKAAPADRHALSAFNKDSISSGPLPSN